MTESMVAEEIDSYEHPCTVDCGCVQCIDEFKDEYHRRYLVNGDYYGIGKIRVIFEHPESDCVWAIIDMYSGGIVEVDLN
jgi:hypothetical protein